MIDGEQDSQFGTKQQVQIKRNYSIEELKREEKLSPHNVKCLGKLMGKNTTFRSCKTG